MRAWKHYTNDSKRVKLLKNCAALIYNELLSSAEGPLRELHENVLITEMNRLNVRIKRAEEERAKTQQAALDFNKRKRNRKKIKKLYVKVK